MGKIGYSSGLEREMKMSGTLFLMEQNEMCTSPELMEALTSG